MTGTRCSSAALPIKGTTMSTSKRNSPSALIRATGRIQGTVINLATLTTLDFYATDVHRDEEQGTLHVWADMRIAGAVPAFLTISFSLRSKDLPSGTYPVKPVEHSQVRSLIYHELPDAIGYDALEGDITLRNFATVDHIEGKLEFTTREFQGKRFSVNVDFDVRGFDSKA